MASAIIPSVIALTKLADSLGINWREVDPKAFYNAFFVEWNARHQTVGESLETVGKLVLANLKNDPMYYARRSPGSAVAEAYRATRQTVGGGATTRDVFLAILVVLVVLAVAYLAYRMRAAPAAEGLTPMPGDPYRSILRRSRAPWMEGRYPEGGMLDWYFQTDPSKAVGDSFDNCWLNPVACKNIGL